MTVVTPDPLRLRHQSGAWLGSSDMARRVRDFDWTTTSLGPHTRWSSSLRSAVALCLNSKFPMAIYWGPELNCIYNDAERDVLGKLHPAALGMPAHALLHDSWDVVGPQLHTVMTGGEGTWADDQPLSFDRRGVVETRYYTYSYSPVFDDDGGVGGVLLVTQETTSRVLADRDMRGYLCRFVISDVLMPGSDGFRVLRDLRSNPQTESVPVILQSELQSLLNELKAAQRRVATAGDTERRRIERNLHDGAQQRLMAVRLELGIVSEHLEDDPASAHCELDRLRGELDEALEELRELAHGLYPPLLASDGLLAAISGTARRAPIPVEVDSPGVPRLPQAIENAAYFCCTEALQNAVKHGGAGVRAVIHLVVRHGALEFRVSDNGLGFDRDAVPCGYGLTSLADRAAALGGEVVIRSRPGEGTSLTGQIPLA